MSEGGEKTEEPTDKKIEDARRKGQVWSSRDLTGVAVFLTGLGILKAMWPNIEGEFRMLFAFSFEHLAHPDDVELATLELLLLGLRTVLLLTVPVVVGAALVGALAQFIQVGPLFTLDPVMPKLDKLNPIAGLKNMFAKKQLVEMLKSMLKIAITGYVVYGVVKGALGMVVATIHSDVPTTMSVLGELVYRVAVRVGLLFLMFSIFDVWFQHRTWRKELMMSKDEVKREYKESEGDPHHKAKRREMHMEILESAQMDAVRGSDVVVTNPTHLAVALRYDRERDGAPRVICKGVNTRAEAMRGLAADAGVPMMRNVPLAQALYRLEVGQEIPEELYDAVAEVLNFVFGLRAQQAGSAHGANTARVAP